MTTEKEHLEEICQAMLDPRFYPHPISRLERRDTHISVVFLTGEWVYKLKKPVDFGFLNFKDINSRLLYCEQEVLLNQRLTQGVYSGVVKITRSSDGLYHMDGPGKVVEYAVKMRQLPEETNLQNLLRSHHTTSDMMQELGQILARFYLSSEHSPEIDSYGTPQTIFFNVDENFRQTKDFVGSVLDPQRWEFVRSASLSYLERNKEIFLNRIKDNRICDGHGDLRSEHVYFHQGIQVIDCIEFNDRFRYGDVAVDLAFLHMDLDHQDALDQSLEILGAYVETARDPGLYLLLDFYACYRAMVRAKVECFRSLQVGADEQQILKEKANEYLFQAYRHALQFTRPTLWVICGLPASGKTTIAHHLSGHLDTEHIQSDQIRLTLVEEGLSRPTVTAFGAGSYRLHLRQKVYRRMLAEAQDLLKTGHSVVLDATFSLARWREEAYRLAQDKNANIVFVECFCDEENIRKRLEERENSSSFSDARLFHLPDFMKHYEPPAELDPDHYLKINTDQPLQKTLISAMNTAYGLICRQVRKLE